MDSKRVTKALDIRRRHPKAFKQALVQRSLAPGASVAAIAQEAGVNANLLFNWRRLHLQAQTPSSSAAPGAVLLPVTLRAEGAGATAPPRASPIGTIEIDIGGVRVRVRGPVDEASLRIVLHALAGAT
jgi:transposase